MIHEKGLRDVQALSTAQGLSDELILALYQHQLTATQELFPKRGVCATPIHQRRVYGGNAVAIRAGPGRPTWACRYASGLD